MKGFKFNTFSGKWSESHPVQSDSSQPDGLYSPWNFPGQNTGVGNSFLLQGIFPGDLPNPGIKPVSHILYPLSCQWSPRILEWAVYLFSRGFSQPRNGTRVSCIAGEFFTSWATRETKLFSCLCAWNLLINSNFIKILEPKLDSNSSYDHLLAFRPWKFNLPGC